jgi:eukaryotic-like serine/threonine-protein kinase
VAYASDESGRWEIYVRSFANSPEAETRTQVSRDGGHQPRWRGDGRELFYISNDGTVMSVRVISGPAFQAEAPQPLFQVRYFYPKPEGFVGLRWAASPDSKRFLIAREPPSTEPISIVVNWPAEMKK